MNIEIGEKPMENHDCFSGNQWELPTDIGLIEEAKNQLKNKLIDAGWEEDADWLATSFSEALINSIVHGNLEIKEKSETEDWLEAATRVQRERPTSKKVFVSFNITPEQISITVRDEGNGFKFNDIMNPTSSEGVQKSSGRGFLFMRHFFDSVVHNEKGNEVTMTKTK